MSYYSDKNARGNHLRAARYAFKSEFPNEDAAQYQEAMKEYTENEVICRGKELIMRLDPGYVTDDDTDAVNLITLGENMRTKDVRGKAKKTLAREKELEQASKMYQGN